MKLLTALAQVVGLIAFFALLNAWMENRWRK